MTTNLTRQQALNNQTHLKALGLDKDVYIEQADFPVELTTKIEPGSGHRYDIAVEIRLFAEECGITFRTYFRLEKFGSNRKSGLHFDVPAIKELLKRLPHEPRMQFKEHLANCVKSIQKQYQSIQEVADQHLADASLLRELCKSK